MKGTIRKNLILAVCLSLICMMLTACQTAAAKNVEQTISQLGEITIKSNKAISEAEELYNQLSPKEQGIDGNHYWGPYYNYDIKRAEFDSITIEYTDGSTYSIKKDIIDEMLK